MALDLGAFDRFAERWARTYYPVIRKENLSALEWLRVTKPPPTSEETSMSKWKRREHAGWRNMASEDILLTKGDPYEPGTTQTHVLEGETRAVLPMVWETGSHHLDNDQRIVLLLGPCGMAQGQLVLPTWVFVQLYELVPGKVAVELEVADWQDIREEVRAWDASTQRPRILAALGEAITKYNLESESE